jgi:AbrB family looped-hinge helix DNA binding protein
MGKITSKYQVTIPRSIAEDLGLGPGDRIAWQRVGDTLSVERETDRSRVPLENRLRSFDEATARQRKRQKGTKRRSATDRGWKREDLYKRGRTR